MKRLIPGFIKQRIKDLAQKLIAEKVIHLETRVNTLENELHDEYKKRINKLCVEVYATFPDNIPVNEKTKETISRFLSEYNIPNDLNLIISKNDLMFQYSLLHLGSISEAYRGYLSTGLNGLNIIRKIAEKNFGSLTNLESILDFASGYGRLSRFLTVEISPEKIWVSDIKENAVDFQKANFNVNGAYSTYIPEEFKPGKKFDLIFVASLFSHLPKDTFKRWFSVLYNLLSDKGVLAFTVHDISLGQSADSPDFQYFDRNEDILFHEVDDIIQDRSKYGITFVSETYMNNLFSSLDINKDQYYRYPKALARIQDMYVVSKSSGIYDNSIDFDFYP